MARNYIGLLMVALFGLLWTYSARAQEGGDSRFMATVLARLAKRADPVANIYLNRPRIAGMSKLLDQPMSAGKRLNLRVRIAQERVRAGDTRGGIA